MAGLLSDYGVERNLLMDADNIIYLSELGHSLLRDLDSDSLVFALMYIVGCGVGTYAPKPDHFQEGEANPRGCKNGPCMGCFPMEQPAGVVTPKIIVISHPITQN